MHFASHPSRFPSAFLAVALAACSTAPVVAGDAATVDVPSDVAATCRGTRPEVDRAAYRPSPACPDTYAEARARPPSCGGGSFEQIRAGDCGAAAVVHAGCGLHGFFCVYDRASGSLTGQVAYDDVRNHCGRTSSCIQYGTLADGMSCRADGVALTCALSPVGADAGPVATDAPDAADVPDASDVAPFDAGPHACGTQTCGGNQVCVHPCSGIDAGGGGPRPYCVDVPASCGEATCECVRPGACPSTDAGLGGFPSCTQRSPGARDLYCNLCA